MGKTKQKIIEMLKENVGKHFLDSGGIYGRNFERNQKVEDWDKLPEITVNGALSLNGGVTINIYHFLSRALYYDDITERITKAFQKYSNRDCLKEETWEDCLEGFCKRMGWKNSDFCITNTCNEDSVLSQVIQYWRHTPTDIIILRIHGGCDIRGGYTAPVFFLESEEGSLSRRNEFSCIAPPAKVYDDNQLELIGGMERPKQEIIDYMDYDQWVHEEGHDVGDNVILENDGLYYKGRKLEQFCLTV